MPIPSDRPCASCRYFVPLSVLGVDYGECHRYPPTDGHCDIEHVLSTGQSLPSSLEHHSWPLTDKQSWCGEWLPAIP